MKARVKNNIVVEKELPESFTIGEFTWDSYPHWTEVHYDHGWREVIVPEILSTQKLGEMYYDETNDVVKYHVIDKTEEEIQNEILAEAKAQQEAQLMAIKNAKILQEIQEYADEDALNNQAAYPFWEAGMQVAPPFRVQDFNNENELVLWRCEQGHQTQEDWRPKDTPALWVRVGYDDEILDWVQPTGAHDAYNTGDKAKHNGFVWTSKVDGNVWEPTEANSTLWEKGEEV